MGLTAQTSSATRTGPSSTIGHEDKISDQSSSFFLLSVHLFLSLCFEPSALLHVSLTLDAERAFAYSQGELIRPVSRIWLMPEHGRRRQIEREHHIFFSSTSALDLFFHRYTLLCSICRTRTSQKRYGIISIDLVFKAWSCSPTMECCFKFR